MNRMNDETTPNTPNAGGYQPVNSPYQSWNSTPPSGPTEQSDMPDPSVLSQEGPQEPVKPKQKRRVGLGTALALTGPGLD